MSKVQEGMILLDRLHKTSGQVGQARGGLDRVNEYEDAKLAIGRFLKSLTIIQNPKRA